MNQPKIVKRKGNWSNNFKLDQKTASVEVRAGSSVSSQVLWPGQPLQKTHRAGAGAQREQGLGPGHPQSCPPSTPSERRRHGEPPRAAAGEQREPGREQGPRAQGGTEGRAQDGGLPHLPAHTSSADTSGAQARRDPGARASPPPRGLHVRRNQLQTCRRPQHADKRSVTRSPSRRPEPRAGAHPHVRERVGTAPEDLTDPSGRVPRAGSCPALRVWAYTGLMAMM